MKKNINVRSSQIKRESKLEISGVPQSMKELRSLIKNSTADELKKMGVMIWSKFGLDDESEYLKKGEIHYLFPGEWYNVIPNGFEVTGLFGTKFKFINGETDDDTRYGCLSFGFIRSF